MATAKERGVKIAFKGKASYFYAEPDDMGHSEMAMSWLIGRYATLHSRIKKDDSKIVIRILNPLQTPHPHLNQLQYFVIDKQCLLPVDDKELFTAKLKGL